MITVAADQYLYNIRSYLPENINLKLYDPENGLPSDLDPAEALLIRTVTSLNKQTLPNIPKSLKFVGTASAGTDHVDTGYLSKHGIAFADAAGCNARSVAEYVATVLLIWSEHQQNDVTDYTVGIVGAGHVGTALINLLSRLGIGYVAYDPPREEREADFKSAAFDEVMDCDVLTFHTPLNRSGDYPTWHWLDANRLQNRRFALVLNTSRGGIVDEKALLHAYHEKRVQNFVIDVWENEPDIDETVARHAFIKTPHIAGYSIQAKENASKLVADALIKHFNLSSPENEQSAKSQIIKKPVTEFNDIAEVLTTIHPIKEYEKELCKILAGSASEKGKRFNKLRTGFPLRQQFNNIYLPSTYFKRFPLLNALGVSSINEYPKKI